MDPLVAKSEKVLSDLIDKAQVAAPAAYHAVLGVTQLGCVGQIITGLVALLLTVACILICRWAALRLAADDSYSQGEGYVALIVVFGLASVLIGIYAMLCLMDWWNWVGAFNPQAYLLHQAIDKVLAH